MASWHSLVIWVTLMDNKHRKMTWQWLLVTEVSQMLTQRRITPESERMIRDLYHDGYKGTGEVSRLLAEAASKGRLPLPVPSSRTVRRILDELMAVDLTGPVGLGDLNADDARLVLEVLAAVIESTSGRVDHITRAEAGWLVKISAAAPDLRPLELLHFARQYVVSVHGKKPTAPLDALLAFRPWSSDEAFARYNQAVSTGGVTPHAARIEPHIESLLTLVQENAQRGGDAEARAAANALGDLTGVSTKRRSAGRAIGTRGSP